MTKPLLLASSPTLEGISRLVNEYFCGGGWWTIHPDSLEILDPDGGSAPSEYRVVRKGRRYRFEVDK